MRKNGKGRNKVGKEEQREDRRREGEKKREGE